MFTIPIKSDDFDDDSEDSGLYCKLKFEYMPTYPEDLPIVDIEDAVRLDDDDEQSLRNHIKQQVIQPTLFIKSAKNSLYSRTLIQIL